MTKSEIIVCDVRAYFEDVEDGIPFPVQRLIREYKHCIRDVLRLEGTIHDMTKEGVP